MRLGRLRSGGALAHLQKIQTTTFIILDFVCNLIVNEKHISFILNKPNLLAFRTGMIETKR